MKKTVLILCLVLTLFLAFGGIASAATATDIWNDFNDNGVLDGTYTDAELRAYLNNATLHQYPPDATKIKSLDALVRGMLSARDRFPFTGAEILLVGVAAVALLGLGIGLRRLARHRS